MKLALCLEYPIDQFGGTEVLVAALIKGLAGRHQILLVSADSSDSAKDSSVGAALSGHLHWNPASISVAQSRRLAESLAQTGVDLAHFHFGGNYAWGNRAFQLSPVIHSSRRGIPLLSTNHGAFSIMDGYCGVQRSLLFKLALFLPAWLSKQYVLSHLKCEVTVSQHDYRAVQRWYPFMRHKFRQIYHSRLQAPLVKPTPPAERRKVILCVGTIGPRKGQPALVEAFCRIARQHPDWDLALVGRTSDGAMMKRIQALISQHGLGSRVHAPGECADEQVEQWLNESAIFAMPSVREGLGLSLQEALFRGCACVGSRVGGIPDLIQAGDNGLLVPVGEVAPLAEALDRLISDPALRARFSARARPSVLEKGMTAPRMVGAYEQLYAEILPDR